MKRFLSRLNMTARDLLAGNAKMMALLCSNIWKRPPWRSPDETLIQGSGRTDAGVHALGQVAHLDVPDKFDARAVMMGLNAKCQSDKVRVLSSREVAPDMHARFSATYRAYLYRILNRPAPAALLRHQVWHIPQPLDVDAMQEAANLLIGSHDFTSFPRQHLSGSLARPDIRPPRDFTARR